MEKKSGADMAEAASVGMDREYAEKRAKKPHLIFRYRTRALLAARALRKHGPGDGQGLHVLDIGSADGLTLREMSARMPGARFTGLEYSGDFVRAAGELPGNIRIFQGDAAEPPEEVAGERYGGVTALAVLEHLPDPARVLARVAGLLEPGGVFVATCPHPGWDAVSERLGLVPGGQHAVDMTLRLMRRLVEEAGLEPVRLGRFMFAPVSFLPYFKIAVPPAFGLGVDRAMAWPRLLNFLFVNQYVIARK